MSYGRVTGILMILLAVLTLAAIAAPVEAQEAAPEEKKSSITATALGYKVRRAMRRDEVDEVRSLLQQSLEITPVDPSDAKELHRFLLKLMVDYPVVFDSAAAVLVARGVDELQPSFESWLVDSSKHWKRTSAILEVCARLQDRVSEQWLIWALDHRIETIRRVAMKGLARRKSRPAVIALIKYLEKHGTNDGALTYTALRSLTELTGHEYHLVQDWRNFWEINKEHFDPRKPRSTEGTTSQMAEEIEGPTFFGVRIPSHRIVFVIDCSASMEKLDVVDGRERSRIERAKEQLKKAIRSLPKRARFSIIAYNHRVKAYSKSLVHADEDQKNEACYWVNKLRPGGATHTGEALHDAFTDEDMDTVVLLSDGAPARTTGPKTDDLAARIINRVGVWNRLRHVRLFTFGFEGEGRWPTDHKYAGHKPLYPEVMKWFLRELAARNGGGYKDI